MAAFREAHWLVAGLGNPGRAYVGTRHNVGFRVVERLAAEARVRLIPEEFQTEAAWANVSEIRVLLIKPQAFMNLSGPPIAGWLSELALPVERLVVVHDDLDLPLGRLRLTGGAGSGGHRGVASIQAVLGSRDFPRVRLGIGRPADREEAADWVLGAFQPEEQPLVEEMVKRAAAAVQSVMGEGLAVAMARYNVRVMPEADASP